MYLRFVVQTQKFLRRNFEFSDVYLIIYIIFKYSFFYFYQPDDNRLGVDQIEINMF